MNMLKKDLQLSHILQQDGMSDDQRQKLFNVNFEQFLKLKQQISMVRVVNSVDGSGNAQ